MFNQSSTVKAVYHPVFSSFIVMAVDTAEHPTLNYTNAVQALFKKGACVNVTSVNGDTPLHFACARGHTEIVDLLLSGIARVVKMKHSNGANIS
jgi:hypothetical protein